MADQDILSILRQIPLFENVTDEHLEKLAAIASYIDVDEGKTIFREGDDAATVYLIITGRVSLEICAPGMGCRRILTINDGELLGWSPLLENGQLTATARTLVPTRMLEISGDEIRTLCENHPRFGYEFMRSTALALGKRLSATRLQLLNLYGEGLPKSH